MSYDPNKELAGGKFQEDRPHTGAVYAVAFGTVAFIVVSMIGLYYFDRAFIAKRDKEADEKFRVLSAEAAAGTPDDAAKLKQVNDALKDHK
jgi:hypothetical protein